MLDCIQWRCRCPALLYHLSFFLLPLTANHQKFNTALSKWCYVVWRLVLKRYLFSSAGISDGIFNVAVNIFFQHFTQCKDSSDSCFRSRRNLDSHHCGLYSVLTVVLATISQTTLFIWSTLLPHFISLLLSFSPHPQNCILLLFFSCSRFLFTILQMLGLDHWEPIFLFTNTNWDTEKSYLKHVCNIAAVLIFLVYHF